MNTLATPTADPIALAKSRVLADDRRRSADALDLLGAVVGPEVYRPVAETLKLRAGLSLERGEFTAADIAAACEELSRAEWLAKIRGHWDLGAEFAAACVRQRTRRIEKERSDQDAAARKLWLEAELIRNRVQVIRLLKGIGIRVGKDRRQPQSEFTRGEAEVTADEGQEEAEGEAREEVAQAEGEGG